MRTQLNFTLIFCKDSGKYYIEEMSPMRKCYVNELLSNFYRWKAESLYISEHDDNPCNDCIARVNKGLKESAEKLRSYGIEMDWLRYFIPYRSNLI